MSNLTTSPAQWLRELFEYEYCAECGGDAEDHDAIPFMGNWFACCKSTQGESESMTGEMSQAEVTPEEFPVHFAIAEATGGTVYAFDVYQGPYVWTPMEDNSFHRLWIVSDDGAICRIYDEDSDTQSPLFLCDELEIVRELATNRRRWRRVRR